MQAVDSVELSERGTFKVWFNDGTAVVNFTPGVSIAPGEYLAVHADGSVERLVESDFPKAEEKPAPAAPVEKPPTITGPKVS